ncbi:fungal-specific transcription factor domain-containing protein [Ephemerocybe angulata]|uniref:Fungal-specific transcription factor domain-containing protein n=1 Tax=Ephemerocybe angulata TaxID=980116 RepID=A0A8H6I857_9AGAR|nr:fungal-specific transcription factor domain-containing protein [Tulosesus angulatus]
MNGLVPAHVLKGMSFEEASPLMNPLLGDILSSSYQPPYNPALIHETIASLAQYARVLENTLESGPGTSTQPTPDKPPHSQLSERSGSPGASGTVVVQDTTPEKDFRDPRPTDDSTKLSENFRKNAMLDSIRSRLFGPSSIVMIVKGALDLSLGSTDVTVATLMKTKRPEYWNVRPWEIPAPEPKHAPYVFPERDLLHDLIAKYFAYSNTTLPLLNRVIFERGVKAGLHLVDNAFGGTVLGVCAVGALYSKDPRVCLPEANFDEQSGGYRYFRQLRLKYLYSEPPSLYEMQMHTLALSFLRGSSRMEQAWYLLGATLRAAQDIGLHRKKPGDSGKATVEDELRKRVFFCLLGTDQIISDLQGRPAMMKRCDWDLDYPVDCDDQFWESENPELAFKQPVDRPSSISFFIRHLQLLSIYEEAHDAFYSARMPVPPNGLPLDEWNEKRLAEFDSALNQWVDGVPAHLRWDPNGLDSVFSIQSTALFTSFYWIQILIHRPFIASKNKSTLSFSSMAICTNAARAIVRIMYAQSHKGILLPLAAISLYLSGIILLVNMWRGRKAGILLDEQRETETVYQCVKVLRMYNRSWHWTGRFGDILSSLLKFNGTPIGSPDGSTDQDIDQDAPAPVSSAGASRSTVQSQSAPEFASSNHHPSLSGMDYSPEFPMYVAELSRWPYQVHSTLQQQIDSRFASLDGRHSSDHLVPAMGAVNVQANIHMHEKGSDMTTTMMLDQMDVLAGFPVDFECVRSFLLLFCSVLFTKSVNIPRSWSQWGSYVASIDSTLHSQTNNTHPASASFNFF